MMSTVQLMSMTMRILYEPVLTFQNVDIYRNFNKGITILNEVHNYRDLEPTGILWYI